MVACCVRCQATGLKERGKEGKGNLATGKMGAWAESRDEFSWELRQDECGLER